MVHAFTPNTQADHCEVLIRQGYILNRSLSEKDKTDLKFIIIL